METNTHARSLAGLLCSYFALFAEQLRQVNSVVHLTGAQSEETKAAIQRLLRPPTKKVSYNQQRDTLKQYPYHHQTGLLKFGLC